MRAAWLGIAITCVLAGGLCFLAGGYALLWVGFATYALGHAPVSPAPLFLLPLAWIALAGIVLYRLCSKARPFFWQALAFVIAGPVIGFLGVGAIAWGRANSIMSEGRMGAESVFRAEVPFLIPPDATVVHGESFNAESATLTLIQESAPATVLAYYRERLPRDWVQYREMNDLHTFVSPRTGESYYRVSVELAYDHQTRILLGKSEGMPIAPGDELKLFDLNGQRRASEGS